MRIDAWRGHGGLALLGGASLWMLACAPPCYDDGALQGGGDCPAQGGSGSESSGTQTDSETETQASMEGTADSGMMTAEGTSADGSTTASTMCPGVSALLPAETRTFELVLEQSGNMNQDLDGVSRYAAVAEALFAPLDGIVTQRPETRFGMLVFHGLQAGCPVTDLEPPTVNASPPLAALMAANNPVGSSPVPDSIDEAVTELQNDMAPGDKTLVLVLGNEPGSCAIQTPVGAIDLANTRSDTVDAVTAAFGAGFPTRVIDVGGTVQEAFLQQVANAGIGHQPGDPDAPYWVALDRQEIRAAAVEITATNRGCEFPIDDPPVSDEQAAMCDVVVNGASVMYQDPDGWDLADPQTLLLQGAACDSIQDGLATVAMMCVCDA